MKLQHRKNASSLVTTLLVIVVLSTIVVAFLQSMSIERLTSKSFANRLQADLLADSAAESAVNRILTAINPYPYSAAFYETAVDGTDVQHLFLARYETVGSNLVTDRVPLFSTRQSDLNVFTNNPLVSIDTAALSLDDRDHAGQTITRSVTKSNDLYTDLNRVTSSSPQGLVGLTGPTGPMVLPGEWIYQTNSVGKVIGRYAFWVDDESSKLDLRSADLIVRGAGTNRAEISLAALTSLGLSTNQVTSLNNFKNQSFPGLTPAITRYGLSPGTSITDSTIWRQVEPYVTQYSLHDLRSPDGNLAVNLNELITTTTNASEVQTQLETLTAAITNNLPNFGERFYQASGSSIIPTTPDEADPFERNPLTYIKKIATNIRDFIDTDNSATVLMEDDSVYTGTAPNFIPYEAIIDEVPLVGKEKGPYLNEYGLVTRIISPDPEPTSSSGDVTIVVRFGHYVELFNPGSSALNYSDLGPNPRIIIANQTPWLNKKDNSALRPADIRMDLPDNFTIPANGYAVLTTDGPPWNSNQTGYLDNGSNRYELQLGTGPGTWSLLGTPGQDTPTGLVHEDYSVDTENISSNRYNVQLNPTVNSYAGCRERLLFVNDQGLIDYSLRIYTVGNYYMGRGSARNPTAISTFVSDGNTSNNNSNPEASGSARLVRGDPRSNTEISELEANTSSSWKSGNSPQYGNNMGSLQKTLGADNYNWSVSIGTANIWRNSWAEYSSSGNNFIANTNMTSVGELGFIYDPARYNISWYRSYGRTLRVGQPDIKSFNRNGNSTVANDENWIGGLGTNSVTTVDYLKNAFQLANVFRTDDDDYGKVNLNGMARGTNAPILSALFQGFAFDAAGEFQATGSLTGKAVAVNALATDLNSEFATNRPLIGVGDLSRLEIFGRTTNTIVTGENMATFAVSDGDREEVYRRTAGLLSTQSLSYSIYAVGQSGTFSGDTFKPSSTVRKRTVVQFQPIYQNTDFPAKPSSWRIIKPWQIHLN